MNPDVSGLRGAFGPAPGDFGHAEAAGGAAKLGEWNGVAVSSTADPSSLLADAAEEMTFGASEEVEKDVADRKKSEKQEPRERLQVNPSAEAQEKMKRELAERLAKLRQALDRAGGDAEAFGEALEELFPDPTERHAALAALGGELAADSAAGQLVARELEALELERGQEIQAGYNIAGVDAGPFDAGPEAFGAYRRAVLGEGDAAGVLDIVLEKSEGRGFVETVDFLLRSVGADLSAATPSSDRNELEALNNDLFNLRALGNFTREFDATVAGLRERHALPPLADAGRDLLKILMKNKDARIVMLEPLRDVLGLQREANPVYDVQALTRTHMLAHKMPVRLFADADARQRLLDGVQKLVDAAVDLEESLGEG